MIKHALFARLEAKPGKEKELAQFLQVGLGMAQQEGITPVWFDTKATIKQGGERSLRTDFVAACGTGFPHGDARLNRRRALNNMQFTRDDFFGLASSVLHAAVSRLNGKEKRRT
jgi:hypothetical protein